MLFKKAGRLPYLRWKITFISRLCHFRKVLFKIVSLRKVEYCAIKKGRRVCHLRKVISCANLRKVIYCVI